MSWLKNMKIGLKLGLITGIPALLLLSVVAFNYYNASIINAEFLYAYENYSSQAMAMNEVRADIQGNQKNILKSILADDAAYLHEIDEDFKRRRAESEEILAKYAAGKHSDDEQRIFDHVNAVKGRFYEAQDECLQLGENDRKEEARLFFFETLDPIAGEFNSALVELSAALVRHAEEAQNAAAEHSHNSSVLSSIVSGVAIVLVLLLSMAIGRAIIKGIAGMKEKIVRFSEGDLSQNFGDNGRDELAQMSRSLENMILKLRGVVHSINRAGGDISDASQDFSALAQETNASVNKFQNNVDEMAANLDNLAATSEEVNASIQEVAAGAQTTAEKGTDIARKVDDAMNAGDKGIGAVRSVVTGIGQVAESSTAATDAIVQLGDRARQIQNFVSQIGGIADQTNLLALNAAIEAARAGEAGRGFAVVAEEVRKLAEDSNVAAKNIADLAGAISSEIGGIVDFAQKNASDSNVARELSQETLDEINNMIVYLRDIANATQDLAAVAEQQAASSEEIAEAVQNMSTKISDTAQAGDNIRHGVVEVAQASQKTAGGAEQLSGLSGGLRQELSFFRLGRELKAR